MEETIEAPPRLDRLERSFELTAPDDIARQEDIIADLLREKLGKGFAC